MVGSKRQIERTSETKESVKGLSLSSSNRITPPVYSSDVPESTHLKRGESKFSIKFDGAKTQPFTSDEPIPTGVNNFGFECWVKWGGFKELPEAAKTADKWYHTLFCNGNQADGFEFSINKMNPYWNFYYGNVTSGFDVPNNNQIPQEGVWTHIALVCNAGMTTLFINGVDVNHKKVKPLEPSERFVLGAINIGSYGFNGLMDEVRFFTFEPGKFDHETDLNYKK